MTLKTEGWEFPGNRTLDNPPTTCGDDGFICIDPEREIALFCILSLRKHVLLFTLLPFNMFYRSSLL